MINFQPFSPVEIQFSSKSSAAEIVKNWCKQSGTTLLLASQGRANDLGIADWIRENTVKFDIVHVDKIPSNPSVEDLCAMLCDMKNVTIANMIAVGGGSCIDLAKAISALHFLSLDHHITTEWVSKAIMQKAYLKNQSVIDILAVPTTSGTGSEVTKWATIWDMKVKSKLSIDAVSLYPKMALMVPELTISLNRRLTLSTGLDALSHAMEAFWAKSRTPLSQALALNAISQVKKYLPLAIQDGNNLMARQGMSVASLLAGLSFSITRTTACHSISYPLTMLYGIEHGFAAALSLTSVAKHNIIEVPEIYRIYEIFGGEKAFKLWIMQLCYPIVSLNMGYFGVLPEQLDEIVEKTFTQGRMDNNPVAFTKEQVKEILTEIL
ncbi:MAG: phosphonoacetaldehyde reductase [Angelakisella sp.]|nr:phosphonoacetaldehyde reductase [Angelakisella sp.]